MFYPRIILFLLTLLVTSRFVVSEECSRQGEIKTRTQVFDRPPAYRFKSGWEYGEVLDTLEVNSPVYICREKNISIGLGSHKWFQIAYFVIDNWRYGWIHETSLTGLSFNKNFISTGFVLVSTRAQKPPQGTLPPPKPPSDFISAPRVSTPEPAGPSHTTEAVSAGAQSSEKLSIPLEKMPSKNQILGLLFAAMIIGMVGKVVYDFTQDLNVKLLKIRGVRSIGAVIVSPIIFGTILVSIDLSIESSQQFWGIMLFAFQNGFFWQDIFSSKLSHASQTFSRPSGNTAVETVRIS